MAQSFLLSEALRGDLDRLVRQGRGRTAQQNAREGYDGYQEPLRPIPVNDFGAFSFSATAAGAVTFADIAGPAGLGSHMHDAPIAINGSDATVIDLAPGFYLILAQLDVTVTDAGGGPPNCYVKAHLATTLGIPSSVAERYGHAHLPTLDVVTAGNHNSSSNFGGQFAHISLGGIACCTVSDTLQVVTTSPQTGVSITQVNGTIQILRLMHAPLA